VVPRSNRNGDAKVKDLNPPGMAGFRSVLVQQLDEVPVGIGDVDLFHVVVADARPAYPFQPAPLHCGQEWLERIHPLLPIVLILIQTLAGSMNIGGPAQTVLATGGGVAFGSIIGASGVGKQLLVPWRTSTFRWCCSALCSPQSSAQPWERRRRQSPL
jgi:hypothetical protein